MARVVDGHGEGSVAGGGGGGKEGGSVTAGWAGKAAHTRRPDLLEEVCEFYCKQRWEMHGGF